MILFERVCYKENKRSAFSVAEMMLVLLIVSLLVLAIPPIVHKKVEKRVSKGEHGRYECWKDLSGNTYEFYATEKGGITDEYKGGGTEKEPLGKKLASGQRCIFKPETMAPNAAYFTFQAIGGGAGGAYAPYNASEHNKQDTSSVDIFGESKDVSGNSFTRDLRYSYKKSYNQALANAETMWVKNFFTPVYNHKGKTVCSGHGGKGKPLKYEIRETNKKYRPMCSEGGEGSPGECMTLYSNKITLSGTDEVALSYSLFAQPKTYKCFTKEGKEFYSENLHWQSGQNDNTIFTDESQGDFLRVIGTNGDDDYNIKLTANEGTFEPKNPERGEERKEESDDPSPAIKTYSNTHTDEEGAGIVSWKENESYDEKISVSSIDFFPAKLTYEKRANYVNPTYGNAGSAGSSVSMLLPKLVSNIEFTIGTSGTAGDGSSLATNGLPTTVWTNKGNSACSDSNSACSKVLVAKGGLAVNSGIILPKLFLRGTYTGSKNYGTINNACNNGEIHGCGDVGVASFDEAPKRFSVSSGFYTIPELDKNSKTPSAIDAFYRKYYTRAKGTVNELTFSPGSGGDGGYSFIVNTSGTESVKVGDTHNNFSLSILRAHLSNPDWLKTWNDVGTRSIATNYANSISKSPADYKCFLGSDTDTGTGSSPVQVDDRVWACKPTTGYPGAVVIVW